MTTKLQLILLLGMLVIIPLLTSRVLPLVPMLGKQPSLYSGGSTYPASQVKFDRASVGEKVKGLPLISNVQILDFDGDGKNEILVCDVSQSRITLISHKENQGWEEKTLIEHVSVPAHATAVDFDKDGDQDLLVAILGNILPDDELIGRVELYENLGTSFRKHILLENVRRVADVQAGDFDGDGDLDLAVAVFGYARGQVLWLENLGNFRFQEHELHSAPGTIHVPIGDFDGDGDIDIAAIVSQDEEEVIVFENLGKGQFQPRVLWKTINIDLGSAGLIASDLDGDGDLDLILPVGDNLEDAEAYPQPYHGCLWFENRGNWNFQMHRISDLGGTYAAAVGDLDGDNDQDVVLVSMANSSSNPQHASIIWLENDGQQNFTPWQIDSQPIHQVTVAVGDLNNDGRLDIASGGLNLRKPYDRIGRVTTWHQRPSKNSPDATLSHKQTR